MIRSFYAVAFVGLLAVTGASAQMFSDPVGDAPDGYDLERVEWHLGATSGNVTFVLADTLHPAAVLEAVFYVGVPDGEDPREWYVLHHGPLGTRVAAGHIEPIESQPQTATIDGNRITIPFDRIDPIDAPCGFAAAAASEYSSEGRNTLDSVPDGAPEPEEAWALGISCIDLPEPDDVLNAIRDAAEDNGIPAPMALVPVTLVAAAAWLRRKNA